MIGRSRIISTHRAEYGVTRLCRVLSTRREGFYEYLAAAELASDNMTAGGAQPGHRKYGSGVTARLHTVRLEPTVAGRVVRTCHGRNGFRVGGHERAQG